MAYRLYSYITFCLRTENYMTFILVHLYFTYLLHFVLFIYIYEIPLCYFRFKGGVTLFKRLSENQLGLTS